MSQTKAQLLDGSVVSVAVSSGIAAAPSLFFTGDSNTGIYSPGADQVAISTGGSGRLFVDASGNVGIAATSPSVALDVAPTTSSAIIRIHARTNTLPVPAIELVRGTNPTFGADAYGDYRIKNDSGSLVVEYGDSGVTTERLRINSSGRVGIGTSSPATALNVQDSAGEIVRATVSSNTGLYANIGADGNGGWFGSNADLSFRPSGTERARIDSSGRLLVGTSSAVAGSVTTTAIVGSQLTKSTGFRTVSGSGTLDLDLSEGTGIAGHLYVSSTRQSNAAVKTNTIFFISTRQGSNTAITSLNSNNGPTAGSAYTVTNPSANIFRFTDTAAGGNVTVSLCFVGTLTD